MATKKERYATIEDNERFFAEDKPILPTQAPKNQLVNVYYSDRTYITTSYEKWKVYFYG